MKKRTGSGRPITVTTDENAETVEEIICPANIRLDEDVLKTSFVFVFRRRLDQDEYVGLSLTSSEDVFKTSW